MDSDVTQSFTSRRLQDEDAIVNGSISDSWLRGIRSKESYSCENAVEDSQSEDDSTETAIAPQEKDAQLLVPTVSHRSRANLDTMPDEILGMFDISKCSTTLTVLDLIFSLVTTKPVTDHCLNLTVDLFNLLFVSKTVHAAALRVLYRHVKVPYSKSFFKFHNSLCNDTHLGKLVQCLDFSHYTSMGFGRAKTTSNGIPYLTPTTLKACLDTTTNLKAFLVHEHVDSELDTAVLTTLLEMKSLKTLDLCACSSTSFTQAFTKICTQISSGPRDLLLIERLSLHECTTLKPQTFEALLPRLGRLTHLDLAHTMVNDEALLSIPKTARITHLNLERCTQITGPAVIEFLTTHPAVKDTIVYLNLQSDASRYRLLSDEDLSTLLPALPATLRSLNIGGAKPNKSHVNSLRILATHVEELGLKGADLSISTDIREILSLDKVEGVEKLQHSVRYLDLTDIKSVNQMSLTYSPKTIIDLDTTPLEVIELGESIRKDIEKRNKNVKNPEWKVTELGRRGWFVRQNQNLDHSTAPQDDGHRPWKMGTRWWGMRKIPVFDQETGGMYGYFMFKRG